MKYSILVLSLIIPFTTFAAGSVPTNFSQVNSALSRGGSPSSYEQMLFLQQRGVRTIVNLQGADLELKMFPSETRSGIKKEKNNASSLNMQFINMQVPAVGLVSSKMKANIRRLIAEMRRPENQPVYVHCLIGNDRTSLISALFLYCSGQSKSGMRTGHNGLTSIFTGGLDLFYKEATSTPGWCLDPNF